MERRAGDLIFGKTLVFSKFQMASMRPLWQSRVVFEDKKKSVRIPTILESGLLLKIYFPAI